MTGAGAPWGGASAVGGGAAKDAAARGFVIAGTHSGVGKTSLSLGIMGALGRRGHYVAPFKVGPDYIDPTYHRVVTGRPSRNLDTWLMPPGEMVGVFGRAVAAGVAAAMPAQAGVGAPAQTGVVAVVEGVMGLFDGLRGDSERCSTAEVAKLLDLPVVLVVDCSSMARSAAAVVHGFSTFDPDLRVAGVILNKVGSASHAAGLREAIGSSLPIVGVVPRRPDLHLTSRHLGLIPTVEDGAIAEVLDRIVAHIEEHLDLDLLLALGRPRESPAGRATAPPGDVAGASARRGAAAAGGVTAPVVGDSAAPVDGRRRVVAVARDRAFSFYYEDNLEVLAEEGADVVTFAPADGETLPACDALYLGGGYPEVYAADLANNTILQRDLRAAAAEGLPVYAECGGYLYLGREIEYEGAHYPMAGVLPTRATMAGGRLRLGYVEAAAVTPHPLAGETFRGHLFHYSSTEGSASPAYRVSRRGESFDDGLASEAVVASYVHLHFRGSRAVARWLASGGVTSHRGRREEKEVAHES